MQAQEAPHASLEPDAFVEISLPPTKELESQEAAREQIAGSEPLLPDPALLDPDLKAINNKVRSLHSQETSEALPPKEGAVGIGEKGKEGWEKHKLLCLLLISMLKCTRLS